jgi:three-Cys-motif partner protein
MCKQQFGGDWTNEKLNRLRKYLLAYTKILSKRPNLKYAYIDAFAGTGYRELKAIDNQTLLLPELADSEPQRFLRGSASVSLECAPPFHRYIFIEKDANKLAELKRNLIADFPEKEKDLLFRCGDANTEIQELCEKNWKQHRAVLFLDPFGMQVTWATIEAIANTKSIDLWVLFPLGVAVNRLLTKNGEIVDSWKHKLDEIFGSRNWYDAFYTSTSALSLFGTEEKKIYKTADFSAITSYYVNRLKSIFQNVADNPLFLYNSRNTPLFVLFFASNNQTAVKIAQHILGKN